MNKSELIEKMADAADISKAAAGRALDVMIDEITTCLKAGDTVSLIGFGTFSVKERAARMGRNPRLEKKSVSKLQKLQHLRLVKPKRCCTIASVLSRGCLAQLGEHRPYKARVGGSIPQHPPDR